VSNQKRSTKFGFWTPILAEEYSTEAAHRIKIGCAFFVTFFGTSKESKARKF
jgi:hypothetical protein